MPLPLSTSANPRSIFARNTRRSMASSIVASAGSRSIAAKTFCLAVPPVFESRFVVVLRMVRLYASEFIRVKRVCTEPACPHPAGATRAHVSQRPRGKNFVGGDVRPATGRGGTPERCAGRIHSYLLDAASNERPGRLVLEEDVATFQPPRQQPAVGVLHEGEEGLARSAHLRVPRFRVIAHPL